MGIIDSLSAGYRFLIQRLELLLLPLLLDAILWIAPRLSIEPLLLSLAELYQNASSDMDTAGMADQMAQLLIMLGQSSNLLDLLVNRTFYHVPSLLVSTPGIKDAARSVEIASGLNAGLLALVLGVFGILIGVIYMNLLARALPLGEGQKALSLGQFVSYVVQHWLRTLVFIVGICLLLLILYIPATIGATLLMLLSPALGSVAVLLLSGLSVVLFFYLYFVTVGLVLDNLSVAQAVMRSVLLVHHNFWSTLGFILITSVISMGMGLLLAPLTVSTAVGMVIAALVNAFLGTGIALALLFFYRTRILTLAGHSSMPASERA